MHNDCVVVCVPASRQAPGSIFTVGNGEQCLSSDRSTGGVCLSRNQCNTQGGKAIGFCGVFATCCSFYIRVNASTNSRSIRINFKIADRNTQPNLPQSTWKIKVTQL
ncbi:Uncharacterized protein OBRU01_22226, partial [Operophtera brumata]